MRLYAFYAVSRNFGDSCFEKAKPDLVEHNGSDQNGSEAAG